MNFVQPLYAKAQQASKIYTRFTLICKVSVLFGFDYIVLIIRIVIYQNGSLSIFR